VDIDISGNRFYSRNTLPVSVSGLTCLGNGRLYSDEERKERENMRQLREKYNLDDPSTGIVTKDDIEDVVARWTGVPMTAIKEEEITKLPRAHGCGRGGWLQDGRFSAPRSQGKRASRMAMLSAAVAGGDARGGAASGRIARSARRARWLRPYALPPRAPRRRSCSGDVSKI
jgi:hypothetical protein